jgi:hypothetical protein
VILAPPSGPNSSRDFAYPMVRDAENGRLDRLRPRIRRICELLGAPSARRPDDMFFPHGGFMHLVPQGEIEAAAGGSGYRILYFGRLTCFTRMRC